MRGTVGFLSYALLAGQLASMATISDAFAVRAPAAAQLTFLVQPVTTPPFATIKPPVQIGALDAQGNPASGFTGLATITIRRNGAVLRSGKLSGTTTVAMNNGVATFSDLSIDQPGNGYTLKATAPGLTAAESAAFNVGTF